MSTSLLYHTQGIRDYRHVSFAYQQGVLVWNIERKWHCCPHCGISDVSVYRRGRRIVTGLPVGRLRTWLCFDVHSAYCHACGALGAERISFLPSQKSRVTRLLAKTIVEYHSCMCLHAIANYFGVRWHTVKAIQMQYLRKTCRNVSCKGVTAIGIDEVMVGHTPAGGPRCLTIVRNLHTGEVLWVKEGRGMEALDGFAARLSADGAHVEYVTLDLGQAYSSWVGRNLPDATVIYDHFHVIKLVNDGLDKVRRTTMAGMDEEARKSIKRQRYLFLRNQEELPPERRRPLEQVKAVTGDLGVMHTMKEALRSIYRVAKGAWEAKAQLRQWIAEARQCALTELTRIAGTFEKRIDGSAAFWDNHLSNAHMEGFNSKLKGLIKMANGYTDSEFLKLKIYDLPDQKMIDLTHLPTEMWELRRSIQFGYSPS